MVLVESWVDLLGRGWGLGFVAALWIAGFVVAAVIAALTELLRFARRAIPRVSVAAFVRRAAGSAQGRSATTPPTAAGGAG